jgi:hypothetical protein
LLLLPFIDKVRIIVKTFGEYGQFIEQRKHAIRVKICA